MKRRLFSKLKKYDYDISKVIGVKKNQRFILYSDKKLIRIYRDNLKTSALLCSYIPIEDAIFYSFLIERSIIEKVELDSFIETKVYEEAGLLETEEYIIKYKVVELLEDEKRVMIHCVIVSAEYIKKNFEYIVEESGYLDYLSFPAFSYKTLYIGDVLKKANDLFIVFLYDKIFLTFYSNGELVSIITITGGLNKIYENLQSLKIKDFDIELFKKILLKKGLNIVKYSSIEIPVFKKIEEEMSNRIRLIKEQISNIIRDYSVLEIDRIFVTSEFGDIPGINDFFQEKLNINSFDFEFYKEYNLDKLPVDPFLFLAMLETYYAYKNKDYSFNYSLFLRKPTFFYRPSGILITTFLFVFLALGVYPMYLYCNGEYFLYKSRKIEKRLSNLETKKNSLIKEISLLKDRLKKTKIQIDSYKNKIDNYKNLIKTVYQFKFSYKPKSKELVEITKLMNKNHIYLNSLDFNNSVYDLNVSFYDEKNLGKFLNDLVNKGYNVTFNKLIKNNNKFLTNIKVKE